MNEDTNKLLANLIFAFDLHTLKIESNVSKEIQTLELTEEMLLFAPDLKERADVIAYHACYMRCKEKKPELTKQEFESSLNLEGFKIVSQNIQNMLKSSLSLTDMKEFQRVKSLNLTRVDKDRQIS